MYHKKKVLIYDANVRFTIDDAIIDTLWNLKDNHQQDIVNLLQKFESHDVLLLFHLNILLWVSQ